MTGQNDDWNPSPHAIAGCSGEHPSSPRGDHRPTIRAHPPGALAALAAALLWQLATGSAGILAEPPDAPSSAQVDDQASSNKPLICGSPEERATRGQPFPPLCQPRTVHSNQGELSTELAVTYAANQIGRQQVCLRSYNGGLVGPTLRVKPGDTMNVSLKNQLSPTPNSRPGRHHGNPNIPHGFNITNLHTHGLHVSPAGNADNVLLSLYPGDDFHNEIKLPADHPPGTHWYHAHHHGSVALQVSSGMAGALIVEGGLDQRLSDIYRSFGGITERLLVVQQPSVLVGDCMEQDGEGGGYEPRDVATAFCGYASSRNVGCRESYKELGTFDTTVNGQTVPRFTANTGEVQRWRLIHAGIRGTLSLTIEGPFSTETDSTADQGPTGPPLHVIAEDGIAYGDIVPYQQLFVDSGYRVDALVRFATPGRYLLVDAASSAEDSLLGEAEERVVLARIDVARGGTTWPLPTSTLLRDLAPYSPITNAELYPPDPCLQVEYSIDRDVDPAAFQINGRPYDPADPACRVPLGSAQEWRLSASRRQTGNPPRGSGNHPHHIHTNPFQVLNPPASRRRGPLWKDTWLVREVDAPIRIRTRYHRYLGDFVMHCHILQHEDQGMMQDVSVELHPPKALATIPPRGQPVTGGTLCHACPTDPIDANPKEETP